MLGVIWPLIMEMVKMFDDPPVIVFWDGTRPSNFDLKRNVWRLNQISQIIDNEIYVKGDPAISDLATLNRFPTLIEAIDKYNWYKIGE